MSDALSSGGWKAAQAGARPAVETIRRRSEGLAAVLPINLVASALHFGDNMLRFRDYPEPAWITGPHVVDALGF